MSYDNRFGKIGKLGFGFMRLPRNESGFDYPEINRMVDKFLEHGYSYFDTAYVYQGSEEALRESLVRRHPREKFQIATKLHVLGIEKPEGMQECFDTSLERLGVDYVDFYLLHGLSAKSLDKLDEFDAWGFVRGLKEKGLVRHIGFSFHDTADVLDDILTKHPEMEFVQLQINYLDWEDDEVQSRLVWETAKKHGVPVTIMEPVKGGMLASDNSPIRDMLKAVSPEASLASWAMRFAASLDGVVTVLSGMGSYEQLLDNLATIDNLTPLSDVEMQTVRGAADLLNSIPRIPCTDCKYCVENCPQKIKIPLMMSMYSDYMVYQTTSNIEHSYRIYTSDGTTADTCVACGSCEAHCPQKIGIIDTLGKLSSLFDN